MKERPGIAVREDTEEVNRWKSEMYPCWKILAERWKRNS